MGQARRIYSLSWKLSDEIKALQEEVNKYKEELDLLKYAIVLDEDSIKIMDSMDVSYTMKSNYISIFVKNNSEICKSGSNIKKVVDGTISAEIYQGEKLIKTIHIPLGVYGLGYLETYQYRTMFVNKTNDNGEYTAKLLPNKLWIMEK